MVDVCFKMGVDYDRKFFYFFSHYCIQIFSKSDPNVVAVLDWELSTLGHPLSDLAFNCMIYHLPQAKNSPISGFGDVNLKYLGIPTEERYISHYIQNANVPEFTIDDWQFAMAFSFFRAASILQVRDRKEMRGKKKEKKKKKKKRVHK